MPQELIIQIHHDNGNTSYRKGDRTIHSGKQSLPRQTANYLFDIPN